jgi:hypothetical protein
LYGPLQVARELRSCRNEYERQAQEIADLDYNLKLVNRPWLDDGRRFLRTSVCEKLIEQEKFGVMQREKHRKLAEKVHGSQASVCRQRDRWKVEFFTEAGVTLNARLLLLSPYGVCVVQASRI